MPMVTAPLRVWRWLTAPHSSITEPEAQLQARAVAGITLVATLCLVLLALVSVLPSAFTAEFTVALMLLTISYGISRTRGFRYGGGLSIATLWAFALVIAVSPWSLVHREVAMGILRITMLTLLITSILYSVRFMLLLQLVMILTLLALSSANTVITQFVVELLLMVLTFGLVFAVLYQFDRAKTALTLSALHDAEVRYRAITEDQGEFICRWLPDYTVLSVNDAYIRFLGLSREQVIERGVFAYVEPELLAEIEAKLAAVTPENPSVLYEYSVELHGAVCWLQWIDRALFDDEGRVVEYHSVGRDVTALKQAQAAEADERRFAEMLSHNAALINRSLDLDQTMDMILEQAMLLENVEASDICIIEEDNVVRVARSRGYERLQDGRFVEHFNAFKLKLKQFDTFSTMLETRQPLLINDTQAQATWLRSEVGAWVHAYVGAPIQVDGAIIGFLNVASTRANVFSPSSPVRLQAFADQAGTAIRNARLYETVRRHADELESLVRQRTHQLTLTTQRLGAILDSTGEGIFYSEGNRMHYVNDVLCHMMGYSVVELLGSGNLTFLHPGDLNETRPLTAIDSILEALRRRGIWRGELLARRQDGSTFDAAITVMPVGSPDEQPLRAVTVVRDISQEKALAEQRARFIAHASHELRTPITNFKTRLYLARHRPDQWERHLDILDTTAEWMAQLVRDLLDISRMERGLIPLERVTVSAQEIAEAVAMMQSQEAERAELALELVLHPTPLLIHVDRERMIQVVTNLVTNAIHYTPAGGRVEIKVEPNGDSDVLLHVIDTGIGITPEDQKLIFQPFYRVASKVVGTGLGLNIVTQIIEQHGGAISVDSTFGEGSCFSVCLPLVAATPDLTSGAGM